MNSSVVQILAFSHVVILYNQVYSSFVNSRTMLRALLQRERIVLKFMKDEYT